MNKELLGTEYKKVFTDQYEIESFRRIASEFYNKNFGEMQKSDIELLMFSIYVDALYTNSSDIRYDDFAIAKSLGITPKKVSLLKSKKEQKYPSANYDWKPEFLKMMSTASYEGKYVKLYIKDVRLYDKLLEVIYNMDAYTEVSLTPQLLTITVPAFLDLAIEASPEKSKEEIKKKIHKILTENCEDYDLDNLLSFRDLSIKKGNDFIKTLIPALLNQIPVIGQELSEQLKPILNRITQRIESKNSKKK